MPISPEEFFGPAEGTPSGKPPAPSGGITADEFFGPDPIKETQQEYTQHGNPALMRQFNKQAQTPRAQGDIVAAGRSALGTGAQAMDMAIGLPNQIAGVFAYTTASIGAMLGGEDARSAAQFGADVKAGLMPEALKRPFGLIAEALGPEAIKAYEDNPIGWMNRTVSGATERSSKAVSNKLGVPPEAIQNFYDSVMGALMYKGGKATLSRMEERSKADINARQFPGGKPPPPTESPALTGQYIPKRPPSWRAAPEPAEDVRIEPTIGTPKPQSTPEEQFMAAHEPWNKALRAIRKSGPDRTPYETNSLNMFQDGAADPKLLGGIAGAAAVAAVSPWLAQHLDKDDLGLLGLGGAALAIKGKGGMWNPRSVDVMARPLRQSMSRMQNLDPAIPMETHIANDPATAWADKAVRNHLNKHMGTATDPLKDVQIPMLGQNVRWEDLVDRITSSTSPSWAFKRLKYDEAGRASGFDYSGTKNVPIHEPIWQLDYSRQDTLFDDRGTPVNSTPGWKTSNKYTKSQAQDAGQYVDSKRALVDYMSHVGDYLREFVPPDRLQQYDLVRAVKETAEQDARQAAKMAKAQASGEGTVLHKQYPDGMKWVEVVSKDALKLEGDVMGHCVGGYCEFVHSGRSKIYSLRDAKGVSHVTIEVNPNGGRGVSSQWARMEGRDTGIADIRQIKGKQNRAPIDEYKPYVQDFVKSGKWGDVADLKNAGLMRGSEVFKFDDFRRAAEQAGAKFNDEQFYTKEEVDKILGSMKGQRGAVDPDLLRKMGTASAGLAGGALLGSMIAQPDDKLAGALLGATVGLALGTQTGVSLARRSKGYRALEAGVKESVREFAKAVNPDLLGQEARNAASILGSNFVMMMQQDLQRHVAGAQNAEFWDRQAPLVQKRFLADLGRGRTQFGDAQLDHIAQQYYERTVEVLRSDQSKGIKYKPLDSFVYQMFEDPGGAAKWLTERYGQRWTEPSGMAMRFIEEAEAAGYRLKTTNPEVMMQAREHASDIAHLKAHALEDMEQFGQARRVTKNDPVDLERQRRTSPDGQIYELHPDANAVFKQAFEGRGLWDLAGPMGQVYRGAMFAKNSIVPLKLVSLFHPLHVALGMAWADGLGRDTKLAAAGRIGFADFLKNVASQSLVVPEVGIPGFPKTGRMGREGWRIMEALKGNIAEADLSRADAASLKLLTEGTFHPFMAAEFRNEHMARFRKSLADVKSGESVVGGSLRTAWNFPFAIMEKFYTKPIFENWIPALKTASFLRNAYAALEANPALLNDGLARMNALRKISKMTDDRFGEMQYKTTFMNKLVKDTMTATFLSYGWQLGFMRSGVGAIPEASAALMKTLETGDFRSRITKGELDKTMFAGYYVMGTMLFGGLMTYAMTGQAPRELLDYIMPKTGDKNPDGTEARVSTPFYTREGVTLPKHIEQEGMLKGLGITVEGKLSPAFGMIKALVTNRDYFNREISDPNASTLTRTGQMLKHVLGDMEPIAVTAEERAIDPTAKTRTLNWLGFTPAPKYVTETPTESAIRKVFSQTHQSVTPYERAEYGKEAGKLRAYKLLDKEQEYEQQLEKMREQYKLTGPQVTRLRTTSGIPTEVKMFQSLTAQQQIKLLKAMPPDDREKFLPKAHKATRTQLEESPE